jgi:predicted aldo/keto reductase-like oxidoreductase
VKYRTFGELDWQVSALGFGAMRLPTIGNDRSHINEKVAIQMIRYAIDHGVNYVDTAYPYHGGNSEVLVGKALQNGYRAKTRLATKMPIRRVTAAVDLERIFSEQLQKLQTEYIDFYLLHGLRRESWQKVRELHVFQWAEEKIADGRIGYLGFSFHDDYTMFKEIVDSYDGWSFCQIHYNYVDTEYQAGTRGLKYAASKNLAIIVMEPIQGGNLAVNPPSAIQAIWDQAVIKRTPAEWALQWVWNQPQVSLALSGMGTMEQVIQNIQYAQRSGLNTLTPSELDIIAHVREKYLELGFIGCTGCRYCVPCPENVAIPEILASYNAYYRNRHDVEEVQVISEKYREAINSDKAARRCVKCGECETKCPQTLPIRTLLRKAARALEPEED